jgi:hypothetical protein
VSRPRIQCEHILELAFDTIPQQRRVDRDERRAGRAPALAIERRRALDMPGGHLACERVDARKVREERDERLREARVPRRHVGGLREHTRTQLVQERRHAFRVGRPGDLCHLWVRGAERVHERVQARFGRRVEGREEVAEQCDAQTLDRGEGWHDFL